MVLTNVHQAVFETMRDMHTDLRECVCECGCGETFFQKRVGRVRKYLDNSHKSKAYTERKKSNNANKPLIGDTIKELLDYLDSVFEVESSLEWLSTNERECLAELSVSDNREAIRAGLNELFVRYCR